MSSGRADPDHRRHGGHHRHPRPHGRRSGVLRRRARAGLHVGPGPARRRGPGAPAPDRDLRRHLRLGARGHVSGRGGASRDAAAAPAAPPRAAAGGLYVCGDHRDTGSLQGALVSGRRAAQAVLADLRPHLTRSMTAREQAAR
ncbi:FAD-dependent oxidoreductase [Nonomuraea thailandensis]